MGMWKTNSLRSQSTEGKSGSEEKTTRQYLSSSYSLVIQRISACVASPSSASGPPQRRLINRVRWPRRALRYQPVLQANRPCQHLQQRLAVRGTDGEAENLLYKRKTQVWQRARKVRNFPTLYLPHVTYDGYQVVARLLKIDAPTIAELKAEPLRQSVDRRLEMRHTITVRGAITNPPLPMVKAPARMRLRPRTRVHITLPTRTWYPNRRCILRGASQIIFFISNTYCLRLSLGRCRCVVQDYMPMGGKP